MADKSTSEYATPANTKQRIDTAQSTQERPANEIFNVSELTEQLA